jgi:Zn-dependent membrane protease YugP
VRLSPQHFSGRSLAALVIAAHETGHAMQDATEYPPLKKRTELARQAANIERVGAVIMLAAPLMVLIARSPHVLGLELLAGALILGTTIVMHAYTLPVELDASFRRALPLLKAGRYIPAEDLPAARQLLRAAAFTYVAAAAMSLINIARWLQVLRF